MKDINKHFYMDSNIAIRKWCYLFY